MRVSSYYGGTFLTATDLAGKTHRLQVDRVDVENIGDERETKLVVSFTNAKKSLVLNKTNASALASSWGDETDLWSGRWLEVFSVPVTFNGRSCEGIRVRPVVEMATAKFTPPAAPGGAAGVRGEPIAMSTPAGVDDIPF